MQLLVMSHMLTLAGGVGCATCDSTNGDCLACDAGYGDSNARRNVGGVLCQYCKGDTYSMGGTNTCDACMVLQ